jgi:hypothetical protein
MTAEAIQRPPNGNADATEWYGAVIHLEVPSAPVLNSANQTGSSPLLIDQEVQHRVTYLNYSEHGNETSGSIKCKDKALPVLN